MQNEQQHTPELWASAALRLERAHLAVADAAREAHNELLQAAAENPRGSIALSYVRRTLAENGLTDALREWTDASSAVLAAITRPVLTESAERCECHNSPLPGVLLMHTYSDEEENVERCDLCQQYETDEDAADALRGAGWEVKVSYNIPIVISRPAGVEVDHG